MKPCGIGNLFAERFIIQCPLAVDMTELNREIGGEGGREGGGGEGGREEEEREGGRRRRGREGGGGEGGRRGRRRRGRRRRGRRRRGRRRRGRQIKQLDEESTFYHLIIDTLQFMDTGDKKDVLFGDEVSF